MYFLHSPVTSSLLGPNTLLNTLFSNTLSLCSSLNVSDQASHPYKTTGRIIVLYIWIFKFYRYVSTNAKFIEYFHRYVSTNAKFIEYFHRYVSTNAKFIEHFHRYVSTNAKFLEYFHR